MTAMDHQEIEEHHFPQRYLAGKLSGEDAARFEEHYLHCRDCLERLELAGSLRRGLRHLAAGELAALGLVTSAAVTRAGRLSGWQRRSAWLAAAVFLAVALVPSGFLYQQLVQRGHALEQDVQPRVNTAILSLSPSRSTDYSTPENQITLSDAPEWFVLALDVTSTTADDYEAYRVSLFTADRQLRWERSDLVANERGELVIHYHSSFPGPGDYLLSVEGLGSAGEPVFIAPFSLRIARDFESTP